MNNDAMTLLMVNGKDADLRKMIEKFDPWASRWSASDLSRRAIERLRSRKGGAK